MVEIVGIMSISSVEQQELLVGGGWRARPTRRPTPYTGGPVTEAAAATVEYAVRAADAFGE